ncbi:hypothetical protein [Raoultella terrigena]|uniref:hypothetical protein n=1 Tax=Raoultella terrigena TaxID=577 RepID=UPI001F4328E5|nr:hypothetical protein [Raoultella terrigena]
MSEAIINSEQAAQLWPLPDVDLTNLDLFSRGFPHQVFTNLRRHRGTLFHPRTALTPDGEGFWVFTRYSRYCVHRGRAAAVCDRQFSRYPTRRSPPDFYVD